PFAICRTCARFRRGEVKPKLWLLCRHARCDMNDHRTTRIAGARKVFSPMAARGGGSLEGIAPSLPKSHGRAAARPYRAAKSVVKIGNQLTTKLESEKCAYVRLSALKCAYLARGIFFHGAGVSGGPGSEFQRQAGASRPLAESGEAEVKQGRSKVKQGEAEVK